MLLSDSFSLLGRKGGGKEQAKLKVAMMHRGLIWDSARGAGCLFNLVRMWIMWGKIPGHQTGGPPLSVVVRPDSQGPGIPVPLIWAIFVPRSKMWDFCALCYRCRCVFWSISMTCTLLLYGALHLLRRFLLKTKLVVLSCATSLFNVQMVRLSWVFNDFQFTFSTWPAIFCK